MKPSVLVTVPLPLVDTVKPSKTTKFTLLVTVPPGVVTLTGPVVAPAGTVVVISVEETISNVATVPLKVTLVAPATFVPRMMTGVPTAPEVGSVSMNGASPVSNWKTVP